MQDVVIIDSVRTPIGRIGGSLKDVEVDFLAAKVMGEVLRRSGIEKQEIDEVIMGQGKQSTDSPNLARLALLRAHFPVQVPGYTVHRQCGSGIQAVHNAAQQIQSGYADAIVAGGAESMSTAPFYLRNIRFGVNSSSNQLLDPNTESQPRSQPINQYGSFTMGMTAENLAEKYHITRKEQEEFSYRSQMLADFAINKGYFKGQIVSYEVKQKKETMLFDTDEHPLLTSLEKMAALKPVFKAAGTVTAATSSGRNDGASALLLMSKEKANNLGLKPKARIIAQAAVGVSPEVMGIGPVPSTLKALKLADLTFNDIDLIELNEAFAAQALAVIKEWNIGIEKINVNGGAIALGHPIGASGAILLTKLLHELERRGGRYGLVTLCIAGGLGITTIVENLQL